MIKQFMIICTIIMLLCVGLNGCLEEKIEKQDASSDQISEEVIIRTDKTEYYKGDIIKITISNYLKEKITLGICIIGTMFFGNWSRGPNFIKSVNPQYHQINASETVVQFWDGTYEDSVYCLAFIGVECPSYVNTSIYNGFYTHRLCLSYITSDNEQHFIYSNDFKVKKESINDSKIIGKWAGGVSNLTGEWNMTFFTNGSFLMSIYVGVQDMNTPLSWGRYEINNEQKCLILDPDHNSVCLHYEFTDNDTFLKTSGELHLLLRKVV